MAPAQDPGTPAEQIDAAAASARTRKSRMTLATIAGCWIVSDLGYYFLLPAIGRQASYIADPVAISIYYLFWIGLAVILFWPIYATWGRYAPWATFGNRLASAVIWCVLYGSGVAFAGYIVPTLSPAFWPADWGPAPDLVVATDGYFLPKSLDILFQQLLVLALVLTLSAQGLRLWRASLVSAALFGGIHILLIFGGMPMVGVARFVVFAAAFGLLMPTLILRIPNGFAFSYALQWGYYAVTILSIRTSARFLPPS